MYKDFILIIVVAGLVSFVATEIHSALGRRLQRLRFRWVIGTVAILLAVLLLVVAYAPLILNFKASPTTVEIPWPLKVRWESIESNDISFLFLRLLAISLPAYVIYFIILLFKSFLRTVAMANMDYNRGKRISDHLNIQELLFPAIAILIVRLYASTTSWNLLMYFRMFFLVFVTIVGIYLYEVTRRNRHNISRWRLKVNLGNALGMTALITSYWP